MSLHSINVTILSFRVHVILYLKVRQVFAFVRSFVFDNIYDIPTVRQSEIFSGSLIIP